MADTNIWVDSEIWSNDNVFMPYGSTGGSSWLTYSPISGGSTTSTTETQMDLGIAENKSITARTSTITLTSAGGVSKTVRVTQSAGALSFGKLTITQFAYTDDAPACGSADNPLVPTLKWQIPYGWNGKTDEGYIDESNVSSFSSYGISASTSYDDSECTSSVSVHSSNGKAIVRGAGTTVYQERTNLGKVSITVSFTCGNIGISATASTPIYRSKNIIESSVLHDFNCSFSNMSWFRDQLIYGFPQMNYTETNTYSSTITEDIVRTLSLQVLTSHTLSGNPDWITKDNSTIVVSANNGSARSATFTIENISYQGAIYSAVCTISQVKGYMFAWVDSNYNLDFSKSYTSSANNASATIKLSGLYGVNHLGNKTSAPPYATVSKDDAYVSNWSCTGYNSDYGGNFYATLAANPTYNPINTSIVVSPYESSPTVYWGFTANITIGKKCDYTIRAESIDSNHNIIPNNTCYVNNVDFDMPPSLNVGGLKLGIAVGLYKYETTTRVASNNTPDDFYVQESAIGNAVTKTFDSTASSTILTGFNTANYAAGEKKKITVRHTTTNDESYFYLVKCGDAITSNGCAFYDSLSTSAPAINSKSVPASTTSLVVYAKVWDNGIEQYDPDSFAVSSTVSWITGITKSNNASYKKVGFNLTLSKNTTEFTRTGHIWFKYRYSDSNDPWFIFGGLKVEQQGDPYYFTYTPNNTSNTSITVYVRNGANSRKYFTSVDDVTTDITVGINRFLKTLSNGEITLEYAGVRPTTATGGMLTITDNKFTYDWIKIPITIGAQATSHQLDASVRSVDICPGSSAVLKRVTFTLRNDLAIESFTSIHDLTAGVIPVGLNISKQINLDGSITATFSAEQESAIDACPFAVDFIWKNDSSVRATIGITSTCMWPFLE